MANKIYGSVNGAAHKVRKIYGEADGKARKIKNAYIGVNGIAQKVFASAAAFSYEPADGMILSGDLSGKWELAFTKSGTLIVEGLDSESPVTAFAVSGGENGGSRGAYQDPPRNPVLWVNLGGKGGDGGRLLTAPVPLADGTYTVKVGNAGEDTTLADSTGRILINSANGASIAAGGKSANYKANNSFTPAENGQDGQLAFNGAGCLSFPGRKFGASAAGGGAGYFKRGSINAKVTQGGIAGQTGAGEAGKATAVQQPSPQTKFEDGTTGTANTGSGGGAPLGKGGTGTLLLRN